MYLFMHVTTKIVCHSEIFISVIYLKSFNNENWATDSSIWNWIILLDLYLFGTLFNKKLITDGVEPILNHNSFQIDSIKYIQTLGKAYTTLTFIYLGKNLFEIIGKNIIAI